MLKFEKKLQSDNNKRADATLTLTLDERIKSRLKVKLDNGQEAGLFFEKGVIFEDGDLIISSNKELIVEIKAANETLSTIYSDDPLLIARAAYHLGNRHMPLQIEQGKLRYQHDHVLDAMVQGLGLVVKVEQAPFQPESGAYSGGSHSHQHSHQHSHHSHD